MDLHCMVKMELNAIFSLLKFLVSVSMCLWWDVVFMFVEGSWNFVLIPAGAGGCVRCFRGG